MPESIYKPEPGQFYVYVYWNPLKPGCPPFYVGKGKGRRAFQHLRERVVYNRYKHNTIKRIQKSAQTPKITCAWAGSDEKYAYRLERLLIALWKRTCDGGTLTNLSTGGDGPFTGRRWSTHQRRRCIEAMNGNDWNAREWIITFPDGHNEVVRNLRQFARHHNLNGGMVYQLAKGRYSQHKGYTITPLDQRPQVSFKPKPRKGKTYIVTFPNGENTTISNLSAFCRLHKLTPSLMRQLVSGGAQQHRGFRCQRFTG